jgi:hypothetical protein
MERVDREDGEVENSWTQDYRPTDASACALSLLPSSLSRDDLLVYKAKKERDMDPKAMTYISLSHLCGVELLAQNWRPTDNKWTDKNNAEQYAAYLLKTTYYQQGYCAAKVEIKQDGSKRLLIVDPGEPFHLNDVVVTGLQVFNANKLMQGGPKSGEVFSPIRINDGQNKSARITRKATFPLNP